jgi:chromosome segregation ATPase
MASGILGRFGLARAAHVRAATARADKFKTRTAALKQQLHAALDEAAQWKQQAAQLNTRATAAMHAIDRRKAKDAGHLDELATLRDKFHRLQEAEQTIALTRGHLLTMETKLDVLEGAITVLDRRTRDHLEHGTTEPSIEPLVTAKPS